MARIYELSTERETVAKESTQAFQSAHITFMLGSGASHPAIPLAGDIEAEIDAHTAGGRRDEATRLLFDLLHALQAATNDIVGPLAIPACAQTLTHYKDVPSDHRARTQRPSQHDPPLTGNHLHDELRRIP